jgi:hypothetical protein
VCATAQPWYYLATSPLQQRTRLAILHHHPRYFHFNPLPWALGVGGGNTKAKEMESSQSISNEEIDKKLADL